MDLERCVNGKCIASSVVSNTPSNILRHAGANGECFFEVAVLIKIAHLNKHILASTYTPVKLNFLTILNILLIIR